MTTHQSRREVILLALRVAGITTLAGLPTTILAFQETDLIHFSVELHSCIRLVRHWPAEKR